MDPFPNVNLKPPLPDTLRPHETVNTTLQTPCKRTALFLFYPFFLSDLSQLHSFYMVCHSEVAGIRRNRKGTSSSAYAGRDVLDD